MKIAIGCDDNGEPLLDVIRAQLADNENVEFVDLSAPTSNTTEYYPDVAARVATAVAEEGYDRGILVCGTGLGMAMTACKVPGIRAATCHDVYSAERAVKSNNAQIITLGAQIIGSEAAKTVIDAWLNSEWEDGTRSEPKVQRMIAIEKQLNP